MMKSSRYRYMEVHAHVHQMMFTNALSCTLLMLQCTISCCCSNTTTIYKQAKLVLHNQISSKNCYKIDMLCYTRSTTFISLKILSNIGYWNIGKITCRCNTSYMKRLLSARNVNDQVIDLWAAYKLSSNSNDKYKYLLQLLCYVISDNV